MMSPQNYACTALICLFLLALVPARADDAQPADFSEEMPTMEEHLADMEPEKQPSDYDARATAKGDLDGDKIEDLAMIVEAAPGYPQQTILIFKGQGDEKYTLWKAGNTHFLEDHENFMEPHGIMDFSIEKGVLRIQSSISMSMGGWSAGGCTQKWRNDMNGFRLIGLTVVDINRACVCGTTTDTNFMNGRSIITSDRSEDGEQTDVSVTKRKRPSKMISWENFNYDEYCTPNSTD